MELKNNLTVPYAGLDLQAGAIKQDLLEAFERVLLSGQYILGPEVAGFEKEFAGFCQTPFAIGVANGSSALHLVLRGLGVKEGDEVITAPNSFIASASSIALAGAKPVFVDVRPDLNIDPGQLEKAITPHTRVIMPVHLTGRPAAMPEILEIAKRRKIFVLEDAAQAVGARLRGKRVGSWGDAACFSLHPLKNLHAFGDGGVITTREASLYEYLLKARNHGLKNREECEFWSFNSRLDEIQAAMLRVKLKLLDRDTEKRRALAFRYNQLLKSLAVVPEEGPEEYHVYQTYMIQAERRDALKKYLNEEGVQAAVHYPTLIPMQPAAKHLGYSAKDFPIAAKAATRILSLPLFPGMTEAQQDRVVECIQQFYKGKS